MLTMSKVSYTYQRFMYVCVDTHHFIANIEIAGV